MIFAETIYRSGFASGTLAPNPRMSALLPERRKRTVRTIADMGMGDMAGMRGILIRVSQDAVIGFYSTCPFRSPTQILEIPNHIKHADGIRARPGAPPKRLAHARLQ